MAAGHRLSGAFANRFSSLKLVGGIADAELCRDGICLDRRIDAVEPTSELVEIERVAFVTVSAVATANDHDRRRHKAAGQSIEPAIGGGSAVLHARRSTSAGAQPDTSQCLSFEADGHERGGSPGALHQRVGGQCRRNRHKPDVGRPDGVGRSAPAACQHARHRLDHAAVEVFVPRRRLGRGHDPVGVVVVHDGVGERAAGVDA